MDTKNSWSQHEGNKRSEFPYVTKNMPIKEPFETECGCIGILMPVPGPLRRPGADDRMVVWLCANLVGPLGYDELGALEPERQFPHTAKDRCRPFKGTIRMHLVPNETRISHRQEMRASSNEYI